MLVGCSFVVLVKVFIVVLFWSMKLSMLSRKFGFLVVLCRVLGLILVLVRNRFSCLGLFVMKESV